MEKSSALCNGRKVHCKYCNFGVVAAASQPGRGGGFDLIRSLVVWTAVMDRAGWNIVLEENEHVSISLFLAERIISG